MGGKQAGGATGLVPSVLSFAFNDTLVIAGNRAKVDLQRVILADNNPDSAALLRAVDGRADRLRHGQ
ncbi:MAG: hypothetical protein H7338_24210 [Candidatus Sericytochromatia bacterium]|nr:hypothetical protein [Candidatus Sericytochromatia bacterium]